MTRDEKVSFASEVKRELLAVEPSARHCQIAELAGISACIARPGADGVRIDTDNSAVLEKYFTLLDETINIERVDEKGFIRKPNDKRLFELLKSEGADLLTADPVVIQQDCCRRSFLRGFFLCAGSVSNPEKSYHFEMVCRSHEQADQVKDLIAGFGLHPHIVERKGHEVVYLKEGDQIETILGVLGASKAFMDFENTRILKEMRESVNRKVNCETSNIRKSVSAAVRQIEDIEYLQRTGNFSLLNDNLREAAELRLKYPDMPLNELGRKCVPPVGKSGINHRLRKIGQIADSIRES